MNNNTTEKTIKVNISGYGRIPTTNSIAPAYNIDHTKKQILRLFAFKSFRVFNAATGIIITKNNIDNLFASTDETPVVEQPNVATVTNTPVEETSIESVSEINDTHVENVSDTNEEVAQYNDDADVAVTSETETTTSDDDTLTVPANNNTQQSNNNKKFDNKHGKKHK